MKNNNDRYKTWSDASIKAWCNKNVDVLLSLYAEDCTHLVVDPFDEVEPLHGKSAMREYLQNFSKIKEARMLKNEILSASAGRGIGNARVSWTTEDGKTWACDFIYEITLNPDDLCTSYKEWNVVRTKDDR